MKRYVDINDISDGRLFTHNDLAPIGTKGCVNCTECCKVTDDTIHLDPYDIYHIEKALSMSFQELLKKGIIGIIVVDGVITLYLTKNDESSSCVFLNNKGRCDIHSDRPGFCRLFPLGRIYDDEGSFDYFIQIHECPVANKDNVKISEWLGIDNIDAYESFIIKWHDLRANISDFVLESEDKEMINMINMKMLNTFFAKDFDTNIDFYTQINERLLIWSNS